MRIATLIFTLLALTPVLRAEELTSEDQEALKALYNRFHEDTKRGKQTNYPKFLSRDSLEKFHVQHQGFVRRMKTYSTSDEVAMVMKFDPDIDTVLNEKDPKKYFAAISPTEFTSKLSGEANIVNRVVAVGGTRERAFIIVEGFFDGDLGTTEPFYSVHPAVIEAEEWRLDCTSTLVRSLRIKNQQIDAGALPVRG